MWARMSVFLTPVMLVIAAIVIVSILIDRRTYLLPPSLSPASPHYDEAVSLDLSAGQAGVLAHESGAQIEVPTGAVAEAAAVSIREVPLPPSPLEVGRVFDFSLANGRLAEPVTIRIPFDLNHGVDASDVVPLRWKADENAWSELIGEIDAPTQTVAVPTSEGGLFSTVARRTLDSARRDPPTAPAASSPLLEDNMLWENTTAGRVLRPAVVSDGVVYFGGCANDRGNGVYALDAATSDLLWRQRWWSQNGACGTSTPVVSDGIVYVVSSCENCEVVWGKVRITSGDLSALDASTGDLLWRYDNGVAENSSWPVVSGGRVYIKSSSGQVTALDGMTGTVLWEYKAPNYLVGGEPTINEPIVSGGVVYFRENSGLSALDAITGRLLWRYKIEDLEFGISNSELVVSRGVVYAGFFDGYTYAVDAGTGDLLWRSEMGGLLRPLTDRIRGSSPVVSGGMVYTGSMGGEVSALAASTGDLLWQYEVHGSVEFSPIVSRGVVYAASRVSTAGRGGHLYALDAVTGTLLWQHDVLFVGQRLSSPAVFISGDIVYVESVAKSLSAPDKSPLSALDAETGDLRWESKLDLGWVVGIAANSPFRDVVFFVPKEAWGKRIVAFAVERMPEVLE